MGKFIVKLEDGKSCGRFLVKDCKEGKEIAYSFKSLKNSDEIIFAEIFKSKKAARSAC